MDGFFAAYIGIALVYVFVLELICRHLRRFHVETWRKLGEPSFLNQSPRNSWRLFGFVGGSQSRDLDDTRLDRLVLIAKLLFVLLVGAIVIYAFSAAIVSFESIDIR